MEHILIKERIYNEIFMDDNSGDRIERCTQGTVGKVGRMDLQRGLW